MLVFGFSACYSQISVLHVVKQGLGGRLSGCVSKPVNVSSRFALKALALRNGLGGGGGLNNRALGAALT